MSNFFRRPPPPRRHSMVVVEFGIVTAGSARAISPPTSRMDRKQQQPLPPPPPGPPVAKAMDNDPADSLTIVERQPAPNPKPKPAALVGQRPPNTRNHTAEASLGREPPPPKTKSREEDCEACREEYRDDDETPHDDYSREPVKEGRLRSTMRSGPKREGRSVPSGERGLGKIKKFLDWNESGSSNYDALLQCKEDRDRYRSERNQAREKCDELQIMLTQREQGIRLLQDQLSKVHRDHERIKESANLMQEAMDNKELFLGPQSTDEDIRMRFGSLNSSIKTWSANFMKEPANASQFHADSLSSYLDIAPLCREIVHLETLISNRKVRRLFVRGWTSYVVSNLIFKTLPDHVHPGSEGLDLWLGEAERNSLNTLERPLFYADQKDVPPRAFNDWRAFTVELLTKINKDGRLTESATSRIEAAAQEVMSLVGAWASPEKLPDLEHGLIAIFTEAIQLSHLLRRQRALWSVRFPRRPQLQGTTLLDMQPGPLMFDPSSMADEWCEDDGQDPALLRQQYVELVISPALYKRGNLDGERYDVEYVVAVATVLMRPPKGSAP